MLLSSGPPETVTSVDGEPADTAAAVALSLGPAVARDPTLAATPLSSGPPPERRLGWACALTDVVSLLESLLMAMTSTTTPVTASASQRREPCGAPGEVDGR